MGLKNILITIFAAHVWIVIRYFSLKKKTLIGSLNVIFIQKIFIVNRIKDVYKYYELLKIIN